MHPTRAPRTPALGPFAAISAAALATACSLSNPTFNYSISDSGASGSGGSGSSASTSTSTSESSETINTPTGDTESATTGEETDSGPSMAELKNYKDEDCQNDYPCGGSSNTVTLNVECFASEIPAPFILDRIVFDVRIFISSPPAELKVYEYDEENAAPKKLPFATRPLDDIQLSGPIEVPIMPVEIATSRFCIGIAAGDGNSLLSLAHNGIVPQSGVSFLTRTTDSCPVGQHTDVTDLDDVGNWCISAFIHN